MYFKTSYVEEMYKDNFPYGAISDNIHESPRLSLVPLILDCEIYLNESANN